ncbi:dephospho-CoA kinase [Marivivens sp. LCG002]|uniref:dephospho-CoA kinase n=1 Tax=Marivivens sp. LCG002 TaxID=3051171 RepID=UPI0025522F85|nr:dephospho-CoA kinase [Marivivens sp. LCG002]WIV50794.1 dephospho-CoA kinase [Marivivens sp. LCG002]
MTWLLGLTGSIGMGKSTTAQIFRDQGIPVWDADDCVHKLYALGGAAVAPIGELIPDAIVNGSVSREVLKSRISSDRSLLGLIEKIVHPLLAKDREDFKKTVSDILVFDIPLLFETGAEAWLNSVLVVSAPEALQKERVLSRPGMTQEQFEFILSRQMSDKQKRSKADHIIETLSLEQTREDVTNLIKEIRSKLQDA